MIIYNSNKNTFMKYVEKGIISNIVYDAFRKKLGEVSISEQLSWRNSLRHMYNVLNTPTIPDDSGIAIEYRLPYTSKRVDFIISGKNTDNSEHAMIVELKQWQEAKTVKGKNYFNCSCNSSLSVCWRCMAAVISSRRFSPFSFSTI